MVSKGVVTKTYDGKATVTIKRSSACGHDCGECNLCKNPLIETEVLNPIGAKVGDAVLIDADTKAVIKNAFLLYILPVITFFVSYALAGALFKAGYVKLLFVAVCLVLWFLYMRRYSKKNTITSIAREVVYEKD